MSTTDTRKLKNGDCYRAFYALAIRIIEWSMVLPGVTLLNVGELREQAHHTWNSAIATPGGEVGLEKHKKLKEKKIKK